MSSVEERIIGVVAEHMGGERKDITLETDLVRELGMDSIDAQTIMIELEDEFQLSLEFGNLEHATVDDLVRIVEEHKEEVDHLVEVAQEAHEKEKENG